MNKVNRYINMWYCSIVCISLGLIAFVVGMYAKNLYCWSFCAVMFICFTALFIFSNKKLTLEQGYTVIQAMTFYKECKKAGIKKNYKAETALDVASKLDFTKNMTETQVREIYNIGEQYVRDRRKK